MSELDILFLAINTAACGITCWYSLCGLNACTRKTPVVVRYSFACIAVGSFAALLHPPDLDIGGIGEVCVVVGLAGGFLANRRRCVCLNCPTRYAGRTDRAGFA